MPFACIHLQMLPLALSAHIYVYIFSTEQSHAFPPAIPLNDMYFLPACARPKSPRWHQYTKTHTHTLTPNGNMTDLARVLRSMRNAYKYIVYSNPQKLLALKRMPFAVYRYRPQTAGKPDTYATTQHKTNNCGNSRLRTHGAYTSAFACIAGPRSMERRRRRTRKNDGNCVYHSNGPHNAVMYCTPLSAWRCRHKLEGCICS